MKKTVIITVVASILIMTWRYADKREQAEDIVSRMTQEQYDSARKALGEGASTIDIARYYEKNMK